MGIGDPPLKVIKLPADITPREMNEILMRVLLKLRLKENTLKTYYFVVAVIQELKITLIIICNMMFLDSTYL